MDLCRRNEWYSGVEQGERCQGNETATMPRFGFVRCISMTDRVRERKLREWNFSIRKTWTGFIYIYIYTMLVQLNQTIIIIYLTFMASMILKPTTDKNPHIAIKNPRHGLRKNTSYKYLRCSIPTNTKLPLPPPYSALASFFKPQS